MSPSEYPTQRDNEIPESQERDTDKGGMGGGTADLQQVGYVFRRILEEELAGIIGPYLARMEERDIRNANELMKVKARMVDLEIANESHSSRLRRIERHLGIDSHEEQ